MRVVSDTSPVSNLAIIGRLDLLRHRYLRISIPSIVADELRALTHSAAKNTVEVAMSEKWLIVEEEAAGSEAPDLSFSLDPGEIAAIRLALASKADILLIHEKRGRLAARSMGLRVSGLLGELLHTKFAGWLPRLSPEIKKLRDEAGFFIDQEIERFILSQAAE
jgi:predicted nucleic acid-binding protein